MRNELPIVLLCTTFLVPLLAGCTVPGTPQNVASGITGNVTVGPTCPVQHDPPDPNCADKPYRGFLAVAYASNGKQVTTFETDGQGNYAVVIVAGSYTIRNVDGASSLPHCASQGTIIVQPDKYVKADIACDSGIR